MVEIFEGRIEITNPGEALVDTQRFGINEKNRSMASHLIRGALEANAIIAHNPEAPPKQMRYIPLWAPSTQSDRNKDFT